MGGRMGGVTDQGTRERVSCRSILHGLIGMGRCNISRAHWAWSWGVLGDINPLCCSIIDYGSSLDVCSCALRNDGAADCSLD